jgi:hypothetical protein
MAKRGPKPRAGTVADHRVELTVTLEELRALRALARASGGNVADMLRLAALDIANQMGESPPVVFRRQLLEIIRPGSNSDRVLS